MRFRALAVAFAIAFGCVAAEAQTGGTSAEQAACRPDVRKFCGNISGGDSQKYRDCLQSHFQELSQKCQQVLMNHQGAQ